MMIVDTHVAISEHVMRKLEDSFGKAVGLMIFASAIRSAGVPTADLTIGEYRRLVDAICSDERVVGMWGEAGCSQVHEQWTDLV